MHPETDAPGTLSASDTRQICLDEGADDVGFVEIGRESLAFERSDILRAYSRTKTLISVVVAANRESLQSASLSVADWEFARTSDRLASVTERVLRRLNALSVRGVAVPPTFPMDMDRWPSKPWEVSHKRVAEEAGLGRMGLHRVVIHPRLGNHILLATVLIDAEMDRYGQPLSETPCIDCKLCVAVCPVGAIGKDGDFDFMPCAMHNYHELFGGVQEWVEEVAASRSSRGYRRKFRDSETLSRWQSLTYGHAYRCSYCLAVCPAGEETVAVYRRDKKQYTQEVLKPLKGKAEPVYVIRGSAAEKAAQKNACKEVRFVRNSIRPNSVDTFLDGTSLLFNAEAAQGVRLRLCFEFTGKESRSATIDISDGRVHVRDGEAGQADLRIRVDPATWIGIVNEEISPLQALLTGKMKLKGNPAHLKTFKRCLL
jgi:epoxyqueuosine reductase QueG